MKFANLCLLAGITLFTLGCVQVVQEQPARTTQLAVSSVWDMPGNYNKGSRFALSPKYLKEVSLKPEQVKNIYALYAEKITKSLQQHGYQLGSSNDVPDFYVGFGVALSDDLSDKTISEKFGITPGLQEKDELEKGSFLIYVEDAAMQERVWRGAVQGFVQMDLSEEERKTRVEHVVNVVLAQFYKQ